MPGSRKEKRGQVHKRAKDANFGVVETKAHIDHIFPFPRHYRMMPPDLRELMMKDASTLSESQIRTRITISDHYKLLHAKAVATSKAAQAKQDKKNGKI